MYLSVEAILKVALTVERKAIDFYHHVQDHLDSDLLDLLISEEKQHI